MKKTKMIAGLAAALLILSSVPAAWAEEPFGESAGAAAPIETDSGPSGEAGESAGADTTAPEDSGWNVSVPETGEEPVVNVAIPVTVDITIDPLEIGGKGQVRSDAYEIRNHGDTDVILTFSDFEVIFANSTDFEALLAPYDEASESDLKAIYLLLNFGRADIPSIVMTDANTGSISIPLAAAGEAGPYESSALFLDFSGNVNHRPRVDWQSGDVKIRLTYYLEAVPEPEMLPEEEEALSEEETPAAQSEEETPVQEEEPASTFPEEASPPSVPETPSPSQNPEPVPGENTSGSAISLPE